MPDFNYSDRYLRTPEAARFLGLSSRTLEKYRTCGTGPAYRKLGGRVVYALEDIKAWTELGIRLSTKNPRSRAIFPPDRRKQLPATSTALPKV